MLHFRRRRQVSLLPALLLLAVTAEPASWGTVTSDLRDFENQSGDVFEFLHIVRNA